MAKRWLVTWSALVVLLNPARGQAQFTDAHNYDNSPVGLNQLELGYAFVHGNASIDPSLAVAGANVNVNQVIVDYTRYFGLFNRVAWVEAGVPVAHLGGSISGANFEGSNSGVGDSSCAVAMLLKGGPALDVAAFDDYTRTATIGVSVSVTAPTGRYDAATLLNLGSDRWSFKPEVAFSLPFGRNQKWQLDSYANVYFYTDNTSYHGREILRQEPLAGLEEHLSYSFTDNIWASFDSRYAFRGTTFLDGVDQNNAQQNILVGSEIGMALSARHSLLFEVGKAVIHRNSPAVFGFSVKYDYVWGKRF